MKFEVIARMVLVLITLLFDAITHINSNVRDAAVNALRTLLKENQDAIKVFAKSNFQMYV